MEQSKIAKKAHEVVDKLDGAGQHLAENLHKTEQAAEQKLHQAGAATANAMRKVADKLDNKEGN